MRTSVRFLALAGLFGVVIGTIYWYVSYEHAGTVLLLMMGAAPIVIAWFLWRRTHANAYPEDEPNAEHAADAGDELGSFSAGSLWPFVMAVGVLIGLEGFVYGIWLLVAGLLVFAWATVGLMQESRG